MDDALAFNDVCFKEKKYYTLTFTSNVTSKSNINAPI